MRLGRVMLAMGSCVALSLFFCLGVEFQQHVGKASAIAFLKRPAAYLASADREVPPLRYARDKGGAAYRRYVSTVLLPLVIDGKRLSDFQPAAKFAGAIAVVDRTVVILDRLGAFYRYDTGTKTFAPLRLPPLPDNLDAYLHHRASTTNLASSGASSEFRAYDVAFLADRHELAVAYDQFEPDEDDLRTAVSVISIDADLSPTGPWRQVFLGDAYPPGTASSGGGRMAYRDGKLYLTLGDHYTVRPKVSQNPNLTFGKIVEIDLDRKSWKIFTSGHRNPQGLAVLASGQMLSTEQGPLGGDDVNILKEGANYGWPNATLGTEYETYDWTAGTAPVGRDGGYPAPLFAWMPDIAVSQLIEVRNFDPRWNHDLLVGSLKAESLYRLRLAGDRVLYSEQIWIGQRIRDIAQMKDGTIVLWTDDTELLFIRVDRDQMVRDRRLPAVATALGGTCMYCHHFGPTGPNDPAPSLSGVLGRRIASDVFRYSPGLRAKAGDWTKERLAAFLSDPGKFASGTTMPNLHLSPAQITKIVGVLAQASPGTPAQGALPPVAVKGPGG